MLMCNECIERNFPYTIITLLALHPSKIFLQKISLLHSSLAKGRSPSTCCIPVREVLPFMVISLKRMACHCHSTYFICVRQNRGDVLVCSCECLFWCHLLRCHHRDEQYTPCQADLRPDQLNTPMWGPARKYVICDPIIADSYKSIFK